jgi:hypothetical protein
VNFFARIERAARVRRTTSEKHHHVATGTGHRKPRGISGK